MSRIIKFYATSSDPVKERISFARFLNEYRNSMPDIDMDFPHNRRDKIFTKIFDKWDNVVRISNHVLYGQKSAIRKALKDMGVPGRIPKTKCNLNYFSDKDKKKELANRVSELRGQLKNYSLHCGGIIFYSDPKQILKQWPNISFGARLSYRDGMQMLSKSICTTNISKKSFSDHGFITLRSFESIQCGAPFLIPQEHKFLKSVGLGRYVVNSPEDVVKSVIEKSMLVRFTLMYPSASWRKLVS